MTQKPKSSPAILPGAMQKTLNDIDDADIAFSAAFSVSLVAHALLISLPLPLPETTVLQPSAESLGQPLTVHLPSREQNFQPPTAVTNMLDIVSNLPASAAPTLTEVVPTAPRDLISASPELTYRFTHELDQPPVMLNGIFSSFALVGDPSAPNDQAVQGEMLLRLIIDSAGTVRYIQPLRITIPRAVADQIVLQFLDARYRPGIIHGKAVTAEMLIAISLGEPPPTSAPGKGRQPATSNPSREP